MIMENLFDRDVRNVEGVTGSGTDIAAKLAIAGAMEQQNPYSLEVREGVPGPMRGARESVSHDGHISGGSGWRDRFVRSGGIDRLVELLLQRNVDAARGMRSVSVAERGGGAVGVSLAGLSLLLGLLEKFMKGGYLPKPLQLRGLVRVKYDCCCVVLCVSLLLWPPFFS